MTAQSQVDPVTSVPSAAPESTPAPTTPVSEPLASPDMLTLTRPTESSEPAESTHNQVQSQPHPQLTAIDVHPDQLTSTKLDETVTAPPSIGTINNETPLTPNEMVQKNETSEIKSQVAFGAPIESSLEDATPNVTPDTSTTKLQYSVKEPESIHRDSTNAQVADQDSAIGTEPQVDLEPNRNSEQQPSDVSGISANISTVGEKPIDNREGSSGSSAGNKKPNDDIIVPQCADGEFVPSSEHPTHAVSEEDPVTVESAATPLGPESQTLLDHSNKSDVSATPNHLISTVAASK